MCLFQNWQGWSLHFLQDFYKEFNRDIHLIFFLIFFSKMFKFLKLLVYSENKCQVITAFVPWRSSSRTLPEILPTVVPSIPVEQAFAKSCLHSFDWTKYTFKNAPAILAESLTKFVDAHFQIWFIHSAESSSKSWAKT